MCEGRRGVDDPAKSGFIILLGTYSFLRKSYRARGSFGCGERIGGGGGVAHLILIRGRAGSRTSIGDLESPASKSIIESAEELVAEPLSTRARSAEMSITEYDRLLLEEEAADTGRVGRRNG